MGCIDHAKREFLKLGYKPIEEYEEDDPDKWIQENVLELLEVFSKQGHSGGSAPYAVEYFRKLALQEPIAPIMCTDDEWNDIGDCSDDPDFQNNRCSAVFKHGVEGKPYYLDAIVWRNQIGNTFTGNSVLNSRNEKISSAQTIKIPFTPKTFYVDIIDHEIAKDDWESKILDENQLKEVWQYYEKPETIAQKRLKKLKIISEL